MGDHEVFKRLKIDDPATYRICVQGYLEDVWSDRLADMTITIHNKEGTAPESILTGKVRDQAELVGVLNGLYGLRVPILAVELIKEWKRRLDEKVPIFKVGSYRVVDSWNLKFYSDCLGGEKPPPTKPESAGQGFRIHEKCQPANV